MLTHVETLAFVDPNDNGWGHMGGWGGGWMWLFGLAMMILFALLIVWLVRVGALASSPAAPTVRDPLERAREILAERYARGELSTGEYQERVNELK